jgi:hypothetical protein
MKESKRARRRRDLLRMKARARRVFWWNTRPEYFANHLRACSCYGCKRYGEDKVLEVKACRRNGLAA